MDKYFLEKEFRKLKDEIIEAYKKKGMYASGNLERETEVVAAEFNAKIMMPKYTEQMQYGRNPGGEPPYKKIRQWILDKGIFTKAIEEIGLKSLTFLIRRKIIELGYDREDYGGVDLIGEVVTPKRIDDITSRFSDAVVYEFISNLRLEKIFTE